MLDFVEKIDELLECSGKEEENSEKDLFLAEQTQNLSFPRRSQYLAQHISATQTQAYDPDQDRLDVIVISKSYAHLREELAKKSRELVKADSDAISHLIDEANSVFNRGKLKIYTFIRFDNE